MELRHLRYFVVVAEYEHFGRAAKRLGVSQSPLSRQIAQLEEELQAELFTPAGRGVRLTAAGTVFLEGARATLAAAERAVNDAREAAAGRVGTLTIGFENGTAYVGVLPEVIARFSEIFPRVRLELVPMSSGEQWLALRNRNIIASVGYYPPTDPALRSRVISRDSIGVMMPSTHRLAKKKKVRARDLLEERFLWSPRAENPQLYDDLNVALRKRGVVAPAVHERDGESVLTLVAAGFGVSLMMFSYSFAVSGRVVLKEVTDIGVDVRTHIMWRAGDEETPFVRALLDAAKET